jgi:hypothetical protein
MRLKLVRLLALAIALAVPIQGVAAITAGLCMAFGERHGAVTGHDAVDHSTHSHTHADESDSQAHGDESSGNGSHCGPCTACCASASIAGPAKISIHASASNAPYVLAQFPPLGVQSNGLYRPPLAL